MPMQESIPNLLSNCCIAGIPPKNGRIYISDRIGNGYLMAHHNYWGGTALGSFAGHTKTSRI